VAAGADKPSAPRNLRVTESSGQSVSLAWDKSASDGCSPIVAYIVERRDASRNNWVSVARTPAETTKATATNLWEGCDYLFRVASENVVGQSDYVELSKAVSAKPPFCMLVHPFVFSTFFRNFTQTARQSLCILKYLVTV